MGVRRRAIAGVGVSTILLIAGLSDRAIGQSAESSEPSPRNLCPAPALSRVQTVTAQSGDTLDSLALRYNVLPATVLGMNPALQVNPVAAGMSVRIPPFNGIEVTVARGQTWADLAAAYGIRADVLFEVNGCPSQMPNRAFIPGVNWFPGVTAPRPAAPEPTAPRLRSPLSRYPLAEPAALVLNFGWQPHPEFEQLVFNSGVGIEAAESAAVLAAGAGTIAYVGPQEGLGTMVIINHADGFQTRYAQVSSVQVAVGDRIQAGQAIAWVAANPTPPFLYFEVRTNSALGWVARNPGDYIPALAIR